MPTCARVRRDRALARGASEISFPFARIRMMRTKYSTALYLPHAYAYAIRNLVPLLCLFLRRLNDRPMARHISDSQSFPSESAVLPGLAVEGAYPSAVYSVEAMRGVVRYTLHRGVRVHPRDIHGPVPVPRRGRGGPFLLRAAPGHGALDEGAPHERLSAGEPLLGGVRRAGGLRAIIMPTP